MRTNPHSALNTLIELNHRYALDGSDSNSYGGLLWALGLFDRPFPDAPVTGTLRSRSTQSHARRLDLARYGGRITQPSSGDIKQVAVIGAGISGLAAARTLLDQGHRVRVFENSTGESDMKQPLDANGLDQLFRTVRTYPSWQERPVTDEQIQGVYDLLKWGPTSMNCLPGRFVFLRTPEAKARLEPSLMQAMSTRLGRRL
jgi:hypothetical protein